MRLKALVPALQKDFPEAPDVVKALDNLGIKTSFDLLFSSSQYITYGRLPADLISYTSFNAFWEAVITATAATGEAGDVAYDKETQVEEGRFGGETGVEELDTLTSGILGCYGIVEISGVAIQQLALWTVLRHLASNEDASALWIDTTGDVAVDQAGVAVKSMEGKGRETALERLQISLCYSLVAVHDALDALRNTLDTLGLADSSPSPIRFLVIAPINPLFSQQLGSTGAQAQAVLSTFMRQLSSLAQAYRLTVMVLNIPVSSLPRNPLSAFHSTVTKPGLGPTFTYLSDHTVWISKAEDIFEKMPDSPSNVQILLAEVFRSRTMQNRTWCTFGLRNGAILERVVV